MFAALGKRNFALLWIGQFVSLAGDYMLYVALPFYVFQLTGSVLQTGTMFVAETLPRILLGSFAGLYQMYRVQLYYCSFCSSIHKIFSGSSML